MMLGLTDEKENNDGEFVIQLSDKTLNYLLGIVVICIIGLIIFGYFCLYSKKKGLASFKNDMDEMNQNV